MNKFLTIYLSIVESIEATLNQVINLIFQPFYAIARIIISICDIWGVSYEEAEEEEQPQEKNNHSIGFKIK